MLRARACARYGVLVVGEEMKGLVNCNFLPGSARRLELGTVSAEPLSRAYWSQKLRPLGETVGRSIHRTQTAGLSALFFSAHALVTETVPSSSRRALPGRKLQFTNPFIILSLRASERASGSIIDGPGQVGAIAGRPAHDHWMNSPSSGRIQPTIRL